MMLPLVNRHVLALRALSSSSSVMSTLSSTGSVEKHLKPVICVPVAMRKKALKRARLKVRNLERMDRFEGQRHRPIVVCRRSELNHYYRQTYSVKDIIPLASEHWQSRRTHGDYFSFTAFASSKHRSQLDPQTFSELGVDEKVCEALKECGFHRPTAVQAKCIPEIMDGAPSIVASETGNGKTLAYLVPLLEQIYRMKQTATASPVNAPYGLVVVPSRELASQVYDVARDLASPLNVRTRLEKGGRTRQRVLTGERQETDLLVGNFGALEKLFGENFYSRQRIQHVVLDEADTLLDDTFNPQTLPFLGKLGLENRKSDAARTINMQVNKCCEQSFSSFLLGDICGGHVSSQFVQYFERRGERRGLGEDHHVVKKDNTLVPSNKNTPHSNPNECLLDIDPLLLLKKNA